MEIQKQSDINAETVKRLRTSLDMRLIDFWPPVCITASRGCAYEKGKTEIPETVKRLVFLHYVVGIQTDLSAEELKMRGNVEAPERRVRRQLAATIQHVDEATAMLQQAKVAAGYAS